MRTDQLFLLVLVVGFIVFQLGKNKAKKFAYSIRSNVHSIPVYHGSYVLLWCILPPMIVLSVWGMVDTYFIHSLVLSYLESVGEASTELKLNQIVNIANGSLNIETQSKVLIGATHYLLSLQSQSGFYKTLVCVLCAFGGAAYALPSIKPDFRARNNVEKTINVLLILCACIAIITTIGIVLSVLFESLRFFSAVPATEFILGTVWSPQTAIHAEQVGGSGSFGAIPLFSGTLLISAIAMFIAVPVGLMTALYMGEYASSKTRSIVKPLIEMLAGIPTVVYGFVAALSVAPVIRHLGESIGLSVSSESALAAGVVMGVMIIPFVSSLSDDVINSVPQSLRDGSLALGATQSETIRYVVFPAALPGIMGAILLAASRAIGETMIVVMAAGLAAKLTANPLEAVTTITVQIVTLLTGDQEFDSPKTLAAFALGLMLFITTLLLNIYALYIVRKYREQYD